MIIFFSHQVHANVQTRSIENATLFIVHIFIYHKTMSYTVCKDKLIRFINEHNTSFLLLVDPTLIYMSIS